MGPGPRTQGGTWAWTRASGVGSGQVRWDPGQWYPGVIHVYQDHTGMDSNCLASHLKAIHIYICIHVYTLIILSCSTFYIQHISNVCVHTCVSCTYTVHLDIYTYTQKNICIYMHDVYMYRVHLYMCIHKGVLD